MGSSSAGPYRPPHTAESDSHPHAELPAIATTARRAILLAVHRTLLDDVTPTAVRKLTCRLLAAPMTIRRRARGGEYGDLSRRMFRQRTRDTPERLVDSLSVRASDATIFRCAGPPGHGTLRSRIPYQKLRRSSL